MVNPIALQTRDRHLFVPLRGDVGKKLVAVSGVLVRVFDDMQTLSRAQERVQVPDYDRFASDT